MRRILVLSVLAWVLWNQTYQRVDEQWVAFDPPRWVHARYPYQDEGRCKKMVARLAEQRVEAKCLPEGEKP